MADYAAMYHQLFNAVTEAIKLLQKAQKDAEDMYISSGEVPIDVLKSDNVLPFRELNE